MTDYLNNLAAKNLGLTEEIQPRPVSLFEPQPGPDQPDLDHELRLKTSNGMESYDQRASEALPVHEMISGQKPVLPLDRTASGNTRRIDQGERDRLPASSDRDTTAPDRHEISSEIPARPVDQSRSGHGVQPRLAQGSAEQAPQRKEPALEPSVDPHKDSRPAEATPAQAPELTAPDRKGPTSSVSPGLPAQLQTTRQSNKDAAQGLILTEQPRSWPAAAGHETKTEPTEGSSEAKRQALLEPAIQPREIEDLPCPEAPDAKNAIGAETQAISSQDTAGNENQGPVRQPIPHPKPAIVQETPDRVVAQPHVNRYVEPASPAGFKSKASPEPPPTIQVTIGRVEVRATPPPEPQSKKERPKPAVMSRDEYLSMRAKGGS